MRLHTLRTADLDKFYAALATDAGLAPASVRQVHAVVRRALRQAVAWCWIAANPATSASPPKLRRRPIRMPGMEDALQLLSAAHEVNPHFGVFIRMALATGLRRGELCGLRWSDIDFAGRSLTVQRSVAATPGGTQVKGTKTHAARRIAVDATTSDELHRHRGAVSDIARKVGIELHEDAYLFSDTPDASEPWHPDSTSAMFRRTRAKTGLDGVRLHDLRHLHATQQLGAGVPVPTVSGRLGHANAATTLSVYAHFLEANDRQAAGVIDDLLN